jgi:environmental stress-induced protein Ves
MRHLTPADYSPMPWANGKGTTIEMLRVDRNGALLVRLSMATVAEDGPFSLFPGIERHLTVIEGPGFRLQGPGLDLHCAPLQPCAFPGDVPVHATVPQGYASVDFNVMTARSMPLPRVTVLQGETLVGDEGGLALLALGAASVNGRSLARHDLLLTEGRVIVNATAPVIAVHLPGYQV